MKTRTVLPSLLFALLLATLPGHAAAADDAQRLTLAKEALRRAQQSLQSTQSQRDALQQDKTKLEQEKTQLEASLTQAAGHQREATRLAASLAALQAERDALKTQLDAARTAHAALQQRLDETQAQGVETQSQLGEQRRLTATVAGLLQRSVQGLTEAEKQNTALHASGLRAVQAWRTCAMAGSKSADLSLVGWSEVRITSESESLRREMDQLALK